MAYGDRISDLQRRLDALPSELEDLYDRILSSLDRFYLEHAAQLFEFVRTSRQPPSLLRLAVADEDDCFTSAMKRKTKPMLPEEIYILQETMRRRVNSRCKGLLEIGGVRGAKLSSWRSSLGNSSYNIQYLHRTVKDYIESPEIQGKLLSAMKSPYDAYLRHCISILILIKATPLDSRSDLQEEILSFMQYAKGIGFGNEGQLSDLMDEFDDTIAFIADSPIGLYIYQAVSRSSSVVTKAPFNGHILSVAVRYGLLGYVSSRMDSSGWLVPIRQPPGKDKHYCRDVEDRYPLLLDALTWSDGGSPFASNGPSLEMVDFLLKTGADPNTVVVSDAGTEFTVWHAALAVPSSICYGKSSIDAEWKKWLLVYKLLLDHGAGKFLREERSNLRFAIDLLRNQHPIALQQWERLVQKLMGGRISPRFYEESPMWPSLQSSLRTRYPSVTKIPFGHDSTKEVEKDQSISAGRNHSHLPEPSFSPPPPSSLEKSHRRVSERGKSSWPKDDGDSESDTFIFEF
jgi:hypothetical protein